MKISIIGTGYVGLVSGVCLAYKGHKVICVELKKEIKKNLNLGIPHIHENDLKKHLDDVIERGLFEASTNLNYALDNSDIVLLAVGTPSENGKIDLSQIEMVSKQIGNYIKNNSKFLSIIVKSTVVPGTTDNFVKNIIENESGKKLGDYGLGMNPEFLREGVAMNDFMYPDRIVIGYEDEKTRLLLKKMYSPWNCEKLFCNSRTAEMIKYSSNTLLACLISMNNELSNLSSRIGGIDYMDVIEGVSLDKRWSPIVDDKRVKPSVISYFTPGSGFGGSCFPKDVQAIRTQGELYGLDMLMTNSILLVNENQPTQVLEMLRKHSNLKKKVLLLGLAFKPETDDIRESSSIKILNLLLSKKYHVIANDPIAMENTKKEIQHKNLSFKHDWENEIDKTDIIIIGTSCKEYKSLKKILNTKNTKNIKKLIIDCKRLFKLNDFKNYNYLTFGKNQV